ncbi:MAG: hypothetical protein KAX38_04950, partial [Candidatus Krumholzibacteria bacterium]|nr:hypothetical protein [Candidatus Krumholzibacteria bacterium]
MEKIIEDRKAGEEAEQPSDRSRWIAALSYLAFLCFLSLWQARKDPYIGFHARQGFLLLLAECVAVVVIVIFDLAIGKLRFIGLIMIGVLQIVTGLGALTLSVVG